MSKPTLVLAGLLAFLPAACVTKQDVTDANNKQYRQITAYVDRREVFDFDIAPATIAETANAFSTTTGMVVAFPFARQELASQSKGVKGKLHVEDAMQMMLDGTPFRPRYAGNSLIYLCQKEADPQEADICVE